MTKSEAESIADEIGKILRRVQAMKIEASHAEEVGTWALLKRTTESLSDAVHEMHQVIGNLDRREKRIAKFEQPTD